MKNKILHIILLVLFILASLFTMTMFYYLVPILTSNLAIIFDTTDSVTAGIETIIGIFGAIGSFVIMSISLVVTIALGILSVRKYKKGNGKNRE